MDNLVLANLAARPIRSLTSIVGIALGVILILVTVGLARGMLLSTGEREGNLRAELVFLPPSGFGAGISTSPLTLPIAYAEAIAKMPGVAATAPVARYVRTGARGIGFELIEGVELNGDGASGSYPGVTGLTIAEGRFPEGPHELIVDRQRAADPETQLGSKLELLGQTFEVVGVYEPEVGARMKIPLDSMQELLGASGPCIVDSGSDRDGCIGGNRRCRDRNAVPWKSDRVHPGHSRYVGARYPELECLLEHRHRARRPSSLRSRFFSHCIRRSPSAPVRSAS